MRFGKSAAEAAEEPNRAAGGGNFIRRLQEGDNTFRILQEPEEWLYYWEHFSPMGFSFACNNEDDCPGCVSDNEKMKKVSRKIAFNILHSFNGTEYVDAMKIGNAVRDKLENRYKRFGTVTDRDYTVTRYKTSGDRWDFDVEGNTPTPVDLRKEEWKDIESMLLEEWNDAWGDPKQAEANRLGAGEGTQEPAEQRAGITPAPRPKRATIAPQKKDDEPPSEPEVEYQEADLRAMDHGVLVKLVTAEMDLTPPSTLKTSDEVVDWLMDVLS